MKRDVARWVLVFPVVAALGACASSGPKSAAEVAPAMPATPVAAVAQPAPMAMTAPAVANAVASETGAKVGNYRLVVRQGEEYYCKRSGVTGSRVSAKEICMTKEQMQKSREGSQQSLRDMQGNGALDGINLGQ